MRGMSKTMTKRTSNCQIGTRPPYGVVPTYRNVVITHLPSNPEILDQVRLIQDFKRPMAKAFNILENVPRQTIESQNLFAAAGPGATVTPTVLSPAKPADPTLDRKLGAPTPTKKPADTPALPPGDKGKAEAVHEPRPIKSSVQASSGGLSSALSGRTARGGPTPSSAPGRGGPTHGRGTTAHVKPPAAYPTPVRVEPEAEKPRSAPVNKERASAGRGKSHQSVRSDNKKPKPTYREKTPPVDPPSDPPKGAVTASEDGGRGDQSHS